jgi:hypothetical protein
MFVLRSPDRAVLDDREAIECDPVHTGDPILAARPRNTAGFHRAAFSFVGRLVPKVDRRGFSRDPGSKLAGAATGSLDLRQLKFAIFHKSRGAVLK